VARKRAMRTTLVTVTATLFLGGCSYTNVADSLNATPSIPSSSSGLPTTDTCETPGTNTKSFVFIRSGSAGGDVVTTFVRDSSTGALTLARSQTISGIGALESIQHPDSCKWFLISRGGSSSQFSSFTIDKQTGVIGEAISQVSVTSGLYDTNLVFADDGKTFYSGARTWLTNSTITTATIDGDGVLSLVGPPQSTGLWHNNLARISDMLIVPHHMDWWANLLLIDPITKEALSSSQWSLPIKDAVNNSSGYPGNFLTHESTKTAYWFNPYETTVYTYRIDTAARSRTWLANTTVGLGIRDQAMDTQGSFLFLGTSSSPFAGSTTAEDIQVFSIDSSSGALTRTYTTGDLGRATGCFMVDPTGKNLYMVDVTHSEIRQYAVDRNAGSLSLAATTSLSLAPVCKGNTLR
jgi:hypothetical protein